MYHLFLEVASATSYRKIASKTEGNFFYFCCYVKLDLTSFFLLYFISTKWTPRTMGLKQQRMSWLEKKCLFFASICLCLCPNPQWIFWEGPRNCSPINVFILRGWNPSQLWRPKIPRAQPGYAPHHSSREITSWQWYPVVSIDQNGKPTKLSNYICENNNNYYYSFYQLNIEQILIIFSQK